MKKSILAVLVLVAAPALAADMVYSPDYTCAELQQMVQSKGRLDIQMRFGFASYGASAAACYSGEIVGSGTVFGTKDQATCDVGVVCTPNGGGGGNG